MKRVPVLKRDIFLRETEIMTGILVISPLSSGTSIKQTLSPVLMSVFTHYWTGQNWISGNISKEKIFRWFPFILIRVMVLVTVLWGVAPVQNRYNQMLKMLMKLLQNLKQVNFPILQKGPAVNRIKKTVVDWKNCVKKDICKGELKC